MSETGHPDGAPDHPPGETPASRRAADARLKGALLLGLLAALAISHFLAPRSPVASFVVGGLLAVTGFCLMGGGRGRAGLGFTLLLTGLAIGSVGVAIRLTTVPSTPNPAQQDAAVYYQGWLKVEEQRLARSLPQGQAARLAFEPGPGNVLRVETTGVPPEQRPALAERIEKDFKQNYPVAPLQVRVLP